MGSVTPYRNVRNNSKTSRWFLLIIATSNNYQLQLVTLLMRRNQRLVLLLFLTSEGVTEPIERILNSHNVKVAQKPFQTERYSFAKPKDPVTQEQRTDAIQSIPCNYRDHEYIGQTKRQFSTRLKERQKAVLFCEKENSRIHGRL